MTGNEREQEQTSANVSAREYLISQVKLTERELEVLQLKARRRTNAEISEQLFISITTVKWHVRQIYNKLGVNNRSEAVAAARQFGLLEKRSKHIPTLINLPNPLTTFIGREAEQKQLTTIIRDNRARLITLTGPGGIGKSRLALQIAYRLENDFAHGICWVPFSGKDQGEFILATTEDYIVWTILNALGAPIHGAKDQVLALKSYLRQREMLIVLDTFEHLIAEADFLSELLSSTSKIKLLVTSRERLNIPGEFVFQVLGLEVGERKSGWKNLGNAERLFLQTAERLFTKEKHEPTGIASIRHICQRLNGNPLLIEQAALWTRMMSVNEIETQLDHGIEFLDARSNRIQNVFLRSWNLLDEDQRVSFHRLGIFQGGFTLQAATQIARIGLNTLAALFDKSLIQRISEDRFSMHDLVRQFSAGQMAKSGELAAMRDAHCDYFAALVANQKESIYRGDHSMMLPDLDNIRAAWRWAARNRRLDALHKMLWPLDWFFNLRSNYVEAMAAMRLVMDELEANEPQGLQGIVYGKALASYGLEKSYADGADQAAPYARQGIALLRRLGAQVDLAWPLLLSGFAFSDLQERERNYLESLAIFESADDSYGLAAGLGLVLGPHYASLSRYSEAHVSIERGLSISRSLEDPEGEAAGLRALGHLNLHLGRYPMARENFRDEEKLWRSLSLPRLAGEALSSLGKTYQADKKFSQAESIFQASLAEFEQVGDMGGAIHDLLALTECALEANNIKKALGYLQDAGIKVERRSDRWEKARWWQLKGRLHLQQNDPKTAYLALRQALEHSLPLGEEIGTSIVMDFALYYLALFETEAAGRLYGYALEQPGLPAALRQGPLDYVSKILTQRIGEDSLARLREDGAALDHQGVADMLTNSDR